MKKTIIISVILLSAAALTFGQSNYGRQGGNFRGMNNAPAQGRGAVVEIVELKGRITLNENTFPSIQSGKEDFTLIIGPASVESLKLKSGDTVSVEGFKVPGPDWAVDGKSALKVREITVNGKTYRVAGGRGMADRGPGMNNFRNNQCYENYGSNRNFAPGYAPSTKGRR